MKTKIIIGVVVLVFVALFALGILDWRRWSSEARNRYYQGKSALTEKESTTKDPVAASKCRENLRMIESAKRAVADREGKTVGEVSWSAVLSEMKLKSPPKCPSGGEYTLGNIGETPRCSIGGNNTIDKADDHILMNF